MALFVGLHPGLATLDELRGFRIVVYTKSMKVESEVETDQDQGIINVKADT